MSEPATRPLSRNRDFVILWTGDAVSALGSSMSVLVFPLIGYALTGSTALAGLAVTGLLVGEVVFRLPAGALVDRFPRTKVLVATNVCGTLVFGSLAVAALVHGLTLAHLVIAGVASGAVDAFARPATSAATRTIVPAAQLPLAYTRLEARDSAVSIVGPPLGGALYSVARAVPFALDAVSCVAAAFAVSRLRTPLPAPAREPSSLRADIAEGLRWVWDHTGVRAMMLWGGAINFAGAFVFVTVTLRLVRGGTHPASIGLVDTVAAVAGLVGALVAPVVVARARTGLVAITLTVVTAAVVVPMGFTSNVVAIGALLAVSTFFVPANNAGISAYMVSRVPDHLQGRVNSAAGFLANGLTLLAPVAAGIVLASVSGLAATVAGAVLTLLAVIPLVLSSEVRRLGRPADWTAVAS